MSFRPARPLSAFVFVLALAAIASCSGKSDSTSPTPPVTGPTFSFAFPATGSSNRLVFTDLGSWNYHCIPHQSFGMTGTINVVASGGVDSQVVQVGAGGGFVFSPSTVTLNAFDATKPAANGNGYIRWVNVSGLTVHTATRP